MKRLTHMPFTHAFMGSNPVQVTIKNNAIPFGIAFFYNNKIRIKITVPIIALPNIRILERRFILLLL